MKALYICSRFDDLHDFSCIVTYRRPTKAKHNGITHLFAVVSTTESVDKVEPFYYKFDNTENPEVIAVGDILDSSSRCSKNDCFSRRKGILNAFNNLLAVAGKFITAFKFDEEGNITYDAIYIDDYDANVTHWFNEINDESLFYRGITFCPELKKWHIEDIENHIFSPVGPAVNSASCNNFSISDCMFSNEWPK